MRNIINSAIASHICYVYHWTEFSRVGRTPRKKNPLLAICSRTKLLQPPSNCIQILDVALLVLWLADLLHCFYHARFMRTHSIVHINSSTSILQNINCHANCTVAIQPKWMFINYTCIIIVLNSIIHSGIKIYKLGTVGTVHLKLIMTFY